MNTKSPPASATAPVDRGCCPPLSSVVERRTATELAATLRALADPTRLQIIAMIGSSAEGEVCSCDFPKVLGRSQSTTSHHLSSLTSVGILEREQRGKWAWFRIRHDRLEAVAAALIA